MGFWVVLIPIACCVLLPAALAFVALVGFGKKSGSATQALDDSNSEASQPSTPERARVE